MRLTPSTRFTVLYEVYALTLQLDLLVFSFLRSEHPIADLDVGQDRLEQFRDFFVVIFMLGSCGRRK